MVAADGSEWGLENPRAMVEVEEGLEEDRQQPEKFQPKSSKGSVYENWEDNYLAKFSECLGFSTMGFEKEILGLLRKMVVRQQNEKKKGIVIVTKCEWELKKLVSSINYNGRDKLKEGGRNMGNLLLKLR